ncbi:MAG: thioredoxin domain-containing protein [Leptolyngbyaceae cyanobacterium SM1_3_5]|nr:thioredoxin domain-containing protein [Leptolyngbyaceae cyanobacterium SM1_3_5]
MSVLALPVSLQDHIQGAEAASVTLVEYGDYQCPHCAEAHAMIREIQRQLGNSLRYVFRHFPWPDHPQSQQAAEAAEAAGAQGKFWAMHDRLFAAQDALDDGSLVEYAVELNLNVDRFLSEVTGDVHVPRILEDINSGTASGVCSTPALFVNEFRYCNTLDRDTLCVQIDRLMSAS